MTGSTNWLIRLTMAPSRACKHALPGSGQAQGVLLHRQITGYLDDLDPVVLGQQEQVDKLPIPTFAGHVMFPDPMHGIWQLPIHEGRPVTQGAGFAIQQRNIMPRLKVADVAGEAAPVFGNDILA